MTRATFKSYTFVFAIYNKYYSHENVITFLASKAEL